MKEKNFRRIMQGLFDAISMWLEQSPPRKDLLRDIKTLAQGLIKLIEKKEQEGKEK